MSTKAVGVLVLPATKDAFNRGELEMLRRVVAKYREQAPWETHPVYDQLLLKIEAAQGGKR